MTIKEVQQMVGKTMTSVEQIGSDGLKFVADDGTSFLFDHYQNCCESVDIEDIVGDLSDLVGSPIVLAEEVSSDTEAPKSEYTESYTWTFYRFATAKGTVTVRWYGESNGYYSESVDFSINGDRAWG